MDGQCAKVVPNSLHEAGFVCGCPGGQYCGLDGRGYDPSMSVQELADVGTCRLCPGRENEGFCSISRLGPIVVASLDCEYKCFSMETFHARCATRSADGDILNPNTGRCEQADDQGIAKAAACLEATRMLREGRCFGESKHLAHPELQIYSTGAEPSRASEPKCPDGCQAQIDRLWDTCRGVCLRSHGSEFCYGQMDAFDADVNSNSISQLRLDIIRAGCNIPEEKPWCSHACIFAVFLTVVGSIFCIVFGYMCVYNRRIHARPKHTRLEQSP